MANGPSLSCDGAEDGPEPPARQCSSALEQGAATHEDTDGCWTTMPEAGRGALAVTGSQQEPSAGPRSSAPGLLTPRPRCPTAQAWKQGSVEMESWAPATSFSSLPVWASPQMHISTASLCSQGLTHHRQWGVMKRMWTMESDRSESETPAGPSPNLRGDPSSLVCRNVYNPTYLPMGGVRMNEEMYGQCIGHEHTGHGNSGFCDDD